MKTILVTDPRREVHEFLERVLSERGHDVLGREPDLVLTPDDGTARFWSRRGVPVCRSVLLLVFAPEKQLSR